MDPIETVVLSVLSILAATGLAGLVRFASSRPILAAAHKGAASRGEREYAVRVILFNFGPGPAYIPKTGHKAIFPKTKGQPSTTQVDLFAIEHPFDDPVAVPGWGGRVDLGTHTFKSRNVDNTTGHFELFIRDLRGRWAQVDMFLPETLTKCRQDPRTGERVFPDGKEVRLSIAPVPPDSPWRKWLQRKAHASGAASDHAGQNWPVWDDE